MGSYSDMTCGLIRRGRERDFPHAPALRRPCEHTVTRLPSASQEASPRWTQPCQHPDLGLLTSRTSVLVLWYFATAGWESVHLSSSSDSTTLSSCGSRSFMRPHFAFCRMRMEGWLLSSFPIFEMFSCFVIDHITSSLKQPPQPFCLTVSWSGRGN